MLHARFCCIQVQTIKEEEMLSTNPLNKVFLIHIYKVTLIQSKQKHCCVKDGIVRGYIIQQCYFMGIIDDEVKFLNGKSELVSIYTIHCRYTYW